VTLPDPEQYRLFLGSFAADGERPPDGLFRACNALTRSEDGSLGAAPRSAESTRAFVQHTAFDALTSSARIRAGAQHPLATSFGASDLDKSLSLVARLIGSGADTRVFQVLHGNYDTHVDQLPTQGRLLRELGDALASFAAEMKAQHNWERVTVLTFSEFGRRLRENGNGGTDHGAASSLFVTGGGIHGGLHGRMPSLAPQDLFLGDPRFTTDYRSVYATILEKRLKSDARAILGASFPLLEFA